MGTTRTEPAIWVLALTANQRFVVALILAGFVIECLVWPVIKRTHRNPSIDEKRRSQQRLMHEVRRHRNVD